MSLRRDSTLVGFPPRHGQISIRRSTNIGGLI